MAFEGTHLTLDKSTGFVETNRVDAFDAERKFKFVKLFREIFNITKCCEIIGINRMTFMHHREHDPAFKSAIYENKEVVCDNLEETAYKTALKAEGVRDRWRILETYRPDVWGKQDQQNHSITINIDGSLLSHFKAKSEALEAEIVKQT